MNIRFTYRYGGLVDAEVEEVDVDGMVIVVLVEGVVVGNVALVVAVVHFISQSSSSDPSNSLHSVPLFSATWTMVRFLRVKPLPSTHSQSDHLDH